jgi:hypothetical protein
MKPILLSENIDAVLNNKVIEAKIMRSCSCSKAQLEQELKAIVEEFPKALISEDEIIVRTEEIYLSNVNLGNFDIHFPLRYNYLSLRYAALQPNYPRGRRPGSYIHPHIPSHGRPCLGTMGQIINRNLRNGALSSAITLSAEFLKNWGPGCYVPISEWEKEIFKCFDCSKQITLRGTHICEECREIFCYRCRHKCKSCGRAICEECVSKIPHENKRRKLLTFCAECLENIERKARCWIRK